MNIGRRDGGPRLLADNFLRRVILDYFGVNCYGDLHAKPKAWAYLIAAPERDLAFWEELASPGVALEFERLREAVRDGERPSKDDYCLEPEPRAGGKKGGKKENRAGI